MEYLSCISPADHERIPWATELFPGGTYVRPMPERIEAPDPAFGPRVEAFYGELNQHGRTVAPVWVAELDNAVICRSVIYLPTPDGPRIVAETHRPNDRAYTALAPADAIAAAPPGGEEGCAHLYLGSVGSFNYGHFLTDDLPRLAALPAMRARRPGARVCLLLPSYGAAVNRVRADAIAAFLGGADDHSVVFVDPDQPVAVRSLMYCTPVSYHPTLKHPTALNAMADLLPRAIDRPAYPIFVDRRPERGRALLNVDLIRFRLESMGFETVDPEKMGFAEQRSRFSASRLVVGCMGAAMTNTVFCPPGSSVIHLAPEGWTEPYYWDLAAIRGHRYSAIYGAVAAPGPHAHLNDFSLRWKWLREALRSHGLV